MAQANIAFGNLRAEMARKHITISEIAHEIGVNRSSAGSKLAMKTGIKLSEACKIRNKFFPESDVLYLFKEVECDTHTN